MDGNTAYSEATAQLSRISDDRLLAIWNTIDYCDDGGLVNGIEFTDWYHAVYCELNHRGLKYKV